MIFLLIKFTYYEKFFNGKTAPDKLKYMTGSSNRAIAKRQEQLKRRVLEQEESLWNFISNP